MNNYTVYRVIDANLNRLREGLRVVEEFYRFIENDGKSAGYIKTLRHQLQDLEKGFSREELLAARESSQDPFAQVVLAHENRRDSLHDIVTANLRRAQESARSIEEFSKVLDKANVALEAKKIRFSLYTFEKMSEESRGCKK